ncbi:ABC transporter permease [Pseudalkalibacillus sp. R45]|uniref:ABC transporter permease n=1 Tax=Pseudalkalibacillus sp. R45 TaxID=3457433 RepID=UPI003FCC4D65
MKLAYLKKNRYLYLMLVPVLLWYLIFMYVPMYGLVLAFQDYNFSAGYFGSEFVGLTNFKILFDDPSFLNAFENTFIINFYRIVFGFPLPIIFAVLINEVYHMKLKKIVQTITYLPHFISWIVLAGILNSVLSLDSGLINIILSSFGFEQIDFFLENEYFRPMLIITEIWKEIGWNTIIYLAAIAGINPTLYEAAVMDGANRLQRIIHVTIPCIRNVIAIMLILQIGNILQMGFDQIYNLYNPAVFESADIIDTYIVRNLTNSTNLSIPAAAGLIKAIICFGLLVMANWLAKRMGNQGIY